MSLQGLQEAAEHLGTAGQNHHVGESPVFLLPALPSACKQPGPQTCLVIGSSGGWIAVEKRRLDSKGQATLRGGVENAEGKGVAVSEGTSSESCVLEGEAILLTTDGGGW